MTPKLTPAQQDALTAMAAGDALTRDNRGRCRLAGHIPVHAATFHFLRSHGLISLTGTLGDHWYVPSEAGRKALAAATGAAP